MKVLVVSHAYVATVNHDKLAALARLPGVDLTVLVPDRWPSPFGVLRPPEAAAGYRVVTSRVLLGGHIGGHVYLDGLGTLRRVRPDVLHAEVEPWSLAALECLLGAGHARLVLFTWENLDGPRRLLARAIERLVLGRAAFVVAGNEAARARLLRRGLAPDRTAVLPQFGVDPHRYAAGGGPGALARPGLGPPVVGYVGRLVPEKGVDLLVDAIAGLPARLLVVGEGPARPDLERRTAAWPAGKAIFRGAVGHAEVPAHLAGLDALVLPSRTTPRWAEQFGHVLVEAMAAGVPVVGSSSGAIPEVVGEAGLVFREGDAADLRRQLERLLGDEALRAGLRARGRARVLARYTHETVARAQHDIWARVLRG